ncbi:phosphoribosyl pyrophosphate synthetase [Centipeda periodontii DSM 2778]|uniref:Phosphoribosyl pyrophosphate synthetase n=1 Tax=Centipeda periodontii DSM 2778 TaxID=888060 RepID=F5RMR0_9FIRM|nr:hypothetical protein [Centipeda periodontii]EGK59558.1 phosphoribosyl pyrophosphate synthetase [Centipeda periodontii DSM 2778]
MLWLKVLKSLRDYLHAADIADQVILGGYKPSDVRPDENGKGLIFIQRDRERPAGDDLVQDMRVQISVDAWVQSSSKDLTKGYEAIARLEGALMDALRRYEQETVYIADRVQLMRVRIVETGGDGDSVRPLVGSRTSLEIIVYEET